MTHAALRRGHDRVLDALALGVAATLSQQRADGSWEARNDGGPLFLGAALALERALGSLRDEDARQGERSLRAAQRSDGSIAAWPFAEHGSREATSFWLAGMRAVGVRDGDPAVIRARHYIAREGGLARNRLVVRALLAAVGVIAPRTLPRVPFSFALVPDHERALARLFDVNALMLVHTLPALVQSLRGDDGWLARREAQRVRAYLDARQDEAGSWAGVPYYTMQAALLLHRLGVPRDDPRIAAAIAFARSVYSKRAEGLHVGAFMSTHWDTAHAIRVLVREGAAIDRAVRFLVDAQTDRPSPPDWQTLPRDAPRFGGWAWQRGNRRNPDVDTTSEVLMALHEAGTNADVIARGRKWMLALQNPDGGWAAFSWGKRSAPPGPLFVRDEAPTLRETIARKLAEHGDPSTADVTARVLGALGRLGLRTSDARIATAVRFMLRHQLDCGAWWSRWSVNYLPGTSYAIDGLLAAGVPHDATPIARAIAWMLARQNDDGGWGESPQSFEGPAHAGIGPSSTQITGVVVWALCRAGLREHPAIARAIAWLLDRQRPDGTWSDRTCYGVVVPHVLYYFNDGFPTHFALRALQAFTGRDG